MKQEILEHLEQLVSYDTRNPPRAITPELGLWAYLKDQLPSAFEITVIDHGQGSMSFLAVRGQPELLFNVHLDTVPTAEGWATDPHKMAVCDGKAYGIGVCDIKGAAAVLLTLARNTDHELAMLFTTDEEAGGGVCVKEFVKTDHPYRRVVVAEPTSCEAILSHRGISSAWLTFAGASAHSSTATPDSAIHKAVAWMTQALEQAAKRKADGEDIRYNIGRIEGGIKPNMIAAEAQVRCGFRVPPGYRAEDVLGGFREIEPAPVTFDVTFNGPALPDRPQPDKDARIKAWMEGAGVTVGEPVNFWTEASLFSQAGLDALVLGSGNIEQAHAVDEWVAIEQLEHLYEIYRRLTDGS